MKKQFLLIAGAALMLASCGGENHEDQGQSQAQIDSAVNAQVAEREAEMARKNDSMLRAMEAEKAMQDSIAAAEAAKKSTKKTTKTPKSEPPVTPAPPPPAPPKSGGMRGRSDQSQDGKIGTQDKSTAPAKGGGMRGRSDQSQGN